MKFSNARRPALLAVISMVSSSAIAQVASSEYDGLCRTIEDVQSLPEMHWCEVINSKLENVEKKPEEYSDWNGQSSAAYDSFQRNRGVGAVTAGWGGGTLDTKRSRLILWGGGHNGYGGNEIYAFSIRNLEWARLTDPTPYPQRGSGVSKTPPSSLECGPPYEQPDCNVDPRVFPDGAPISRHTYQGLAYMAHTDRLFAKDGAPDSAEGGCGTPGTWTFDFATGRWFEMNPSGPSPKDACNQNAIYDPQTRNVLFYRAGIYSYDIEQDNWTLDSNVGWGQVTSIALDPGRRLLVQVGNSPGLGPIARTIALDDAYKVSELATNGDTYLESQSSPGLAFHPGADAIVGWYGGGDIFSLDVNTSLWTRHSAPASNQSTPPLVSTAGGVFGRFQYVPEFDVFVVVNETHQNVFLYRFSKVVRPAPPDPLIAE